MDLLLGIGLSIFFGFVPIFFFALIIYWLDRYEKEPKLLLGAVFLWGAVVAAGMAFVINTLAGLFTYLATGSENYTDLMTGTLFAPPVEETLKGAAVLLVFLIFRKEFDSILDGIIYASVAALGFAATENAYYIFAYGFQENGLGGILWLTFVRVILVGWQHPFYTSFIGIGLAISRLNRNWLVKIAAPVAGWGLAVAAHSLHNTISSIIEGFGGLLATTAIDWAGWGVMLLFILWAVYREQTWIINQLREEVALGIISAPQYQTACSALAQNRARFSALLSGRYQATNRFYQLTAELAFKKQQRAALGEEGGNTLAIDRLRREIAGLAPRVVV